MGGYKILTVVVICMLVTNRGSIKVIEKCFKLARAKHVCHAFDMAEASTTCLVTMVTSCM